MRDVSDLVSPECPGINCTDPVLSDEHSFSVFPPLQSNTFEFNVIFLCLFCISLCFFKYTNLIAGEVDSVQEFGLIFVGPLSHLLIPCCPKL